MRLAKSQSKQLRSEFLKFHSMRIRSELKAAGADRYDLALPETHYLSFVIQQDERLLGSVYGKYDKGRGALFVTDRRVLFIDKKPLFVNCEEIGFAMIGGVTRTQVGPMGTVTLHTRLGNFKLRTFNTANALNFADRIEGLCLEKHRASGRRSAPEKGQYDYTP